MLLTLSNALAPADSIIKNLGKNTVTALSLAPVSILEKKKDWWKWYKAVWIYLMVLNYWKMCLAYAFPPVNDAAATEIWQKKNTRTYLIFRNKLSYIKDLALGEFEYIKPLFDKMTEMFKPSSSNRFSSFFIDFVKLNFVNYKYISDYTDIHRIMHKKLVSINLYFRQPDPIRIIFFLRGLGPAYNYFLILFNNSNTVLNTDPAKKMDFDHTVARALSEKTK